MEPVESEEPSQATGIESRCCKDAIARDRVKFEMQRAKDRCVEEEKRRAYLESWDATAEDIARYYATLRANGVLDDAAQWLASEFQQRYLSSLGMSDPT